MAKRFLSNPKIVNLASDPASGVAGEFYYNTTNKYFKYHDGTSWVAISAGSTLPIQTGNSGKYLTTDGTSTSWATVNLSSYQPLDADLTAIAALAGTSGFLKKTATDTWALDTTAYTANTGTVTSVSITVPTGLSISGSPITTSGTFGITLTAGYSIPTTASQTNWDNAYTDRNKWDGGSTGLTASTGRTSLGATTVGSNIFTLVNPSTVTYLRTNVDNTVSAISGSQLKTDISLNNVENTALSTWGGSSNIQTIGTVTSPSFTTSIITTSTSFDLINTTATTVNFAKAATSLSIGATTGSTTINNNLVVSGDLTINGTTTTINATTISVDDKNVELGSVATPTNITADGGGITLKGATDKTFNWINATSAWTSSEHINVVSGKSYYINATEVLSATTLGSLVVSSSLTSVGTITSGIWNANIISGQYGGTGVNNLNKTITLGGNLTTAGAFATTITSTATTSVTLPTSGTLIGTSDTGSVSTNMIAASAVTYAKIQNVSSQYRVLGRITSTAGVTEELTPDNIITVINQGTTAISAGRGGTGLTSLGAGIATFLGTPTSANLATAVTDKIGTGVLVFATSPTLTTPNIGVASGTSLSATGNISGSTLTSTVATGTSPLTVTSTTAVTNFNADYLDGRHGTDFAYNGIIAGSSNFNSQIISGTYRFNNLNTNGPGFDWGQVLIMRGSDTISQLAIDFSTATIKVRAGNPTEVGSVGAWTAWRTVWADHNDGAGSGLDADLLDGLQGSSYAVVSGNLSQFAATTSAQLAGVISDETGSGALVFATSPTLTTPNIGVATGTSFNNITGLSSTTPLVDGTAAVGTATTTARADHIHPTDTSRAPLASPTFTGTVTVSGILDASEIREAVVDTTLASNVATLDWTAGNVYYIATAPTAAMTFNVTNVPTDISKMLNITVFVTQAATGFIPSTFQIGGVVQTIRWVSGTAPTPTSSAGKIDVFSFTIQRTSGGVWIVYGTSTLNF